MQPVQPDFLSVFLHLLQLPGLKFATSLPPLFSSFSFCRPAPLIPISAPNYVQSSPMSKPSCNRWHASLFARNSFHKQSITTKLARYLYPLAMPFNIQLPLSLRLSVCLYAQRLCLINLIQMLTKLITSLSWNFLESVSMSVVRRRQPIDYKKFKSINGSLWEYY